MQAGTGADSPPPVPALSVGVVHGGSHDHENGELTVLALAFRRARRPRSIYGTLWVFATAIEGLVFNPGPIVEEFAFTSQALGHGRTEEPENRET